MRGQHWKRSYSSMDTEGDDANNDRVESIIDLHSKSARMLSYIKWLENQEEDRKRRALTIKKIVPNINELSLFSFVMKVLSIEGKELHINSIIDKVIELGYEFKSKYHIYSRVYSIFARNPSLFIKKGRATFKLRSAFVKKNIVVVKKTNRKQLQPTTMLSNKDVINKILEECKDINSYDVWFTMISLGVSIAPRTVDKIVNDLRSKA